MNGSDLDRRTFLRSSLQVGAGLLLPVAGATFGTGTARAAKRRTTVAPPRTPTLRLSSLNFVAEQVVNGPLDATPISALGGLVTEYLIAVDSASQLVPQLATSWRTNDAGTVWSFDIRPGVSFHDGRPMTAESVANSFRASLAAGQAGQLTGIVSADGVRALRGNIVRFTLGVPFGLFPYLVSSDNPPSAVINGRNRTGAGRWLAGTGPYLAVKPKAAELLLLPNPQYWRKEKPRYNSVVVVGRTNDSEAAAQLTEGRVDLAVGLAGDPENVLQDAGFILGATPSTAHFQVHMRTDSVLFGDARVRKAVQLTLDRTAIAKQFRAGRGSVGADSPVASFLPFVSAVAAPKPSIAQAKQSLRDAKKRRGFSGTIACSDSPEAVALAKAVAAATAPVGIALEVRSSATYGTDAWMNSDMGVTEMGHRIAPGLLLAATLGSDGAWNASRNKDANLDALIRGLTISSDREVLRRQSRLLHEQLVKSVPILVPVFLPYLWGARKGFEAAQVSPHGQISV